MMEFEGEASYFGFRLEEPAVQTGNQVPLRPPEEILLEPLWGQSFSAEVQETKGRPEGPGEEETASFESSSTLGDLETRFELISSEQYNYFCFCNL